MTCGPVGFCKSICETHWKITSKRIIYPSTIHYFTQLYHRYKFPVYLRYAYFEFMLTVNLFRIIRLQVMITIMYLDMRTLSIRDKLSIIISSIMTIEFFWQHKRWHFKWVNYLFYQEQILCFLFKIIYHYPVSLPFYKMWIRRLTEEEKV